MFLTVNTELLTMLMTSLASDADALGSIKVEVEEVEGGQVPPGPPPLCPGAFTNRNGPECTGTDRNGQEWTSITGTDL